MFRRLVPSLLFIAAIILFTIDCGRNNNEKKPESGNTLEEIVMELHNVLTEEEIGEGWELLFDGESIEGWRGFGKESVPPAWKAEDGTLMTSGAGGDEGGDIISTKIFKDFELSLEWKISPEGNSGIFFNVIEEGQEVIYATGPEYQLIDDLSFPEPLEDWQTTGANYAMHPPVGAKVKPVGEFNHSRIILSEGHVQHWLNGSMVVEYDLWSEDWKKRVSEGKWNGFPDYGKASEGHIGLQDHGNKIWFRNIKIRVLDGAL
jgi:hypothetical protein